MKRLFTVMFSVTCLLTGTDAYAVCGDVTGDGVRSATDALAVLRASVGQPVDLVCAGEGPSTLRHFNGLGCTSGSSVSEARFHGLIFSADSNEASDYQTVDRTELTSMEVELCGLDFNFPGPINLPPDRSITFFISLLDPDIYGFADIPALITFADDGLPASALTLGTADALPETGYDSVFGGHGLRAPD